MYHLFGGYEGFMNAPEEVVHRHTLRWMAHQRAKKIQEEREEEEAKRKQQDARREAEQEQHGTRLTRRMKPTRRKH